MKPRSESYQYSEKELQLIRVLSPHWYGIICSAAGSSIDPPALYRILVESVFRENKQGLAVESLRRISSALRDCAPYRMTSEFDALIEL